MAVTFSGTYTSTYNLTNSGTQNPLTIASTGLIDVDSATAGVTGILGASGFAWTVVNQGTVESVGNTADGIFLESGGLVVNGQSGSTAGLIEGSFSGVLISSGAGTVVNFGDIEGVGTAAKAVYIYAATGEIINYGTVRNVGSAADIKLNRGGTVTNGASGLIAATGQNGVVITGAAGTVLNSGMIQGAGFGAYLGAGGTIVNLGTIEGASIAINLQQSGVVINGATSATAALIEGANGLGVRIIGSAGTVVNFGTVETTLSANGAAVILNAGGLVTNYGLVTGSNTASAGTPGIAAVIIHGSAVSGTVKNFGTIATLPTNGNGVNLDTGGVLVNGGTGAGTALITGAYSAVYVGGTFGTAGSGHLGFLYNYGTIRNTGTAKAAVRLVSGGTVTNRNLITSGLTGISFENTAGTIANFGTIVSTAPLAATAGAGVYLGNGGLITNAASAAIEAVGSAVLLDQKGTATANATVTNSGTLTGAIGIAIGTSGSTGNNTIINYGSITGTGGISIKLGAVGDEVIIEKGSYLGGALGNFHSGDTIDLASLAFASGGEVNLVSNGTVTNQLQIVETSGTAEINLDPGQNFAGDFFHLSDDGTPQHGTLVTEDTTPCYCRGTLIRTGRGEVPIEDLQIGDRVMTLSGALRPIKWIGRRAYDPRFVAGNRAVLPVCVAAGALTEGVPARDLSVSPEHALFIDGALVPARLLVNGTTIRQVESVGRLEYFHLELDSHDVILAEGAWAESFVDCDNRNMFQNAGEFAALYPGEAPAPWQFCAPRVEPASPELAAIRTALLARAAALGRVTTDPGLHLIADGEIVRPHSVAGRVWRFVLPAGSRSVALASRRSAPAEAEAASADHRILGVAVERIVAIGAGLRIEIGHDCPALHDGFHADEGSHRWSDGRGLLPEALLACCARDLTVEVHLADTELRYPLDPPLGAAQTATRRPAVARRARTRRTP